MTAGDEVIALEERLLDPAVRADPAAVEALLHPDFAEIGASGTPYDRAAIVAALAADPGERSRLVDAVTAELADGVVLLTYTAIAADGARSLRSSVWVRDDGAGWRVRFHQGTPAR